MRTFTTILTVLIVMTIEGYAQIPNSGFESLDGWTEGSATLSTDHYPESIGSYSIKLENQLPLTNHLSYGYAVTGNVDNGCIPSFPIIGHPTSLNGYYKCFPVNGDTIQIGIMLFKNGVWIAGGELITTETVSNWTPFNISIFSYTDSYTNIDADSATITVAAFYNDTTCGLPYGPYGNSILYVDNLSFDNLITTNVFTISDLQKVNIFQNHSTNSIQLQGIQNTVNFRLTDINGRQVLNKNIVEGEKVYLNSLSDGVYMATIKSQNYTVTKKLIIKK